MIHEAVRFHKYENVLKMPIVDISAVLYVAGKYLFALSLDSSFFIYFSLNLIHENIN